MYKYIRPFCIFLIAVFVVHCFPDNVCGAVGIDYYEYFDDEKFEELDIEFSDESKEYGISPVKDKKGTIYAIKTWVSQTRPVKINHPLSSSINNGMFYVSFDYQTTQSFNDCYLRLFSEDKQFQICGFRNTGKFGHFLEFSKWSLNNNTAVDYLPDVWYTVGILFDMEQGFAYLYFGEQNREIKLIESMELPSGFENITDLMLVHSYGDYTPAMWDNISMLKLLITVSPHKKQ